MKKDCQVNIKGLLDYSIELLIYTWKHKEVNTAYMLFILEEIIIAWIT